MRGLVSLCVRHFGSVTALSVLALLLGCWGVMRAPLDVFPEFVPSQVDIQTEAPGFAPQQVEELVTKRIESADNEIKRIIYGLGFAGKEHIALAEKLVSEPPKERFDRVILDFLFSLLFSLFLILLALFLFRVLRFRDLSAALN